VSVEYLPETHRQAWDCKELGGDLHQFVMIYTCRQA
jgi:hypothetical protein